MKKLTILIKPVSSQCHMECQYCFYKDIAHYRTESATKMDRDIWISIIQKTLTYCDEPIEIEYCFQGGEPLLAGIQFYESFIHELKMRNKIHTIKFAIQTNGTLINNDWIDLFKRYNFLVGVSLDGIKKTHDLNRKISGQGSFDIVMSAIELLKKNDIEFNILSVVTSNMVNHAQDIYKFYQDMQFHYVQFIPCLPSLNSDNGLKPKEFFEFYKVLYDEYRKHLSIHISLFDQIHSLFHGGKECSCGMLGYCSIQIVIESDGSIYPCDFYALDQYNLGHIQTRSLKEIFTHNMAYTFLKEEKEYSYRCDECEFYSLCQGNCKRQNICMFNDDYCGYRELLKYIKKREGKYYEEIHNS